MMNTTIGSRLSTCSLPSLDEQLLAEGAYQGRWAYLAGLSMNELEAHWRALMAKGGHDWAIGWPAVVDAYFDSAEA